MAHAMEATRGQREMHARYEGNPKSSESMHDPGPTGRSHMHEARAAAEARGDYIFAKPDHLGIQVMILCARLQGCALGMRRVSPQQNGHARAVRTKVPAVTKACCTSPTINGAYTRNMSPCNWVSLRADQHAGVPSEGHDIRGGVTEHATAHGEQVPAHPHEDHEPQSVPSVCVEVCEDHRCAAADAQVDRSQH